MMRHLANRLDRFDTSPRSLRLLASMNPRGFSRAMLSLCLAVSMMLPSKEGRAQDGCPESACPHSARQRAPEPAAVEPGIFDDVNLERPRSGPGGEALHELAICIDEEDVDCIDGVFHGAEMILRRARAALEDGSIEIERPGLVDHYRARASEGGEERYRRVLHRPLSRCGVSLIAASRGRCDDTGWVDPPDSPLQGVEGEHEALLEDLWEDLSEGLGERRARRVVCGAVRVGDRITAEEAIVVLAKSGEDYRFIDVICTDLEEHTGAPERSGPSRVATWPPSDPEDHAALTALSSALDCLGGGPPRCIEERAPLPGILVRELERGLPRVRSSSDRQSLIDRSRKLASEMRLRANRLRVVVPRQCLLLAGMADPEECEVMSHTPADSPQLPSIDELSAGERAQARAVSALLWGRHLQSTTTTSRVSCPWMVGSSAGERTVELELVWTRGDGDRPILLDMVCGRPGPF